MTPQQLIAVALRLVAIWLALSAVAYFVTVPDALPQGMDGASFKWGAFGIGAVYAVLAGVLWMFPLSVASALLPRTRHANTLQLRGSELARTGCALMGLWLFVKTMPTLAWYFLRALLMAGSGSAFAALSPENKLDMAVSLLNLVLAIVLVAKAGWFARLVAGASAAASPRPAGDAGDHSASGDFGGV